MGKRTRLYYRIDGRNSSTILNTCPKTRFEVQRLPLKEQELWMHLAGCEDKDMKAFQNHRTEAEQKLKSLEEK